MMYEIEWECDECNRDGVICELKNLPGTPVECSVGGSCELKTSVAPIYCPIGGDGKVVAEWRKISTKEGVEDEKEISHDNQPYRAAYDKGFEDCKKQLLEKVNKLKEEISP